MWQRARYYEWIGKKDSECETGKSTFGSVRDFTIRSNTNGLGLRSNTIKDLCPLILHQLVFGWIGKAHDSTGRNERKEIFHYCKHGEDNQKTRRRKQCRKKIYVKDATTEESYHMVLYMQCVLIFYFNLHI